MKNLPRHMKCLGPEFLIGLGLTVAVLLVYSQVRNFGFTTFDDDRYIDHVMVRQGLSLVGFEWALTTMVNGAWMPLTWLSHMLDTQLFGSWAGGHHLTNVLFHLANTFLLFVVLRRLTGALGRSALVAALFALHPLHVESVAWIAERRDVQSAFWSFLAMLAYTGWTRNGGVRRWGLTAVFFIAALAAKPMAVTLPVVFLLLDAWPLSRAGTEEGLLTSRGGKVFVKRLLEKIPFLAISLIISVTTILAEDKQGAVGSLAVYPLLFRVKIALLAYCRYLGLTLWPTSLLPHYPYPASISTVAVVGAFLFLVIVTVWCLASLKKRPYLAVGWFWYLITMLPVIGLIQQGSDFALADRYTYFPLIGIFIIMVWGGAEIVNRIRLNKAELSSSPARTKLMPLWYKNILWAGSLVLLAILAAGSYRQASYWRDTQTLFSHALALDPTNRVALSQLGVFHRRQGQMKESLVYLEKARRLYPADYEARVNLGQLYKQLEQFDAALAEFKAALEIRPDNPDVLLSLGEVLARKGDLSPAIQVLTRGVELYPGNLDLRYNLAIVRLQQGALKQAELDFKAIIRDAPDYVYAHNSLGLVYLAMGKNQAALEAFREAVRVDARFADAQANLQYAEGLVRSNSSSPTSSRGGVHP
ncbi:MAG: tetratricopeptide repeat protein [Proteobacteria bacterium]|nr:tetratricopeptide repeat protein [Pseudomonadota bacterium]MBU1687345.1 tetratricopeptide repeat protein [Pseudomonadota bacterium]